MNVRLIEIVRGTWGLALLVAPRPVLERVHHVRVDRRSTVVARILGARHLTQAALSGVDPAPAVLAVGIWVDVLHAATAVTLGVVDSERRRAGFTDAVVAASWAGFGIRDLRSAAAAPDRPQSRRDSVARAVLALLPGGRPGRDAR